MGKRVIMHEELKRLLRESEHTVAFTGAGISTLSGIRDFRGKNGVYLEPWHGKPVEEILSLDCFLAEPQLFYGWAKEFIYRLDDFHPAAVHRVLGPLEEAGRLDSVYTQNIDLLHRKPGAAAFMNFTAVPRSITASGAAGCSATARSLRWCWTTGFRVVNAAV